MMTFGKVSSSLMEETRDYQKSPRIQRKKKTNRTMEMKVYWTKSDTQRMGMKKRISDEKDTKMITQNGKYWQKAFKKDKNKVKRLEVILYNSTDIKFKTGKTDPGIEKRLTSCHSPASSLLPVPRAAPSASWKPASSDGEVMWENLPLSGRLPAPPHESSGPPEDRFRKMGGSAGSGRRAGQDWPQQWPQQNTPLSPPSHPPLVSCAASEMGLWNLSPATPGSVQAHLCNTFCIYPCLLKTKTWLGDSRHGTYLFSNLSS